MKHIISVIVPIYNSEQYLERCIESILKQTYSNIEIILVDDGSTDNSPSICDQYQKKDSRIKIIHKGNSGAASSRNVGIEIARGDFISFVDSDDYIELNMYEEMMNINKKYECDIVMCDCLKESKTSSEIFTHSIRPGYYDKEMLRIEYFSKLLMTNSVDYPATISNCLCLFKKSLIEKNNLRYKEGMRFSEDLLFGSQAMYFAGSFYYMKNQSFYHYVMNNNSVTHTYYENKWVLMKQLYSYIKEFFSNVSDYDFNKQIDLSLLYMVYHCIGNVKKSNYKNHVKTKKILDILNDDDVKEMFKNLNINSLDISWKLKVYTLVY